MSDALAFLCIGLAIIGFHIWCNHLQKRIEDLERKLGGNND